MLSVRRLRENSNMNFIPSFPSSLATTVSLCCVLAMNEFVNLATYKELRDKGWYNREPIPDQLDSALQSFKDATAVTCVFIGIGWFLLVSLIRWQENYAHLEEIEREKRD
mmetsp:Transcript_16167/g.18149  ORF Transcript_16167/g.18149 Transcript_16167/m.18149 type:complete len:110 (+) Transcript_16167:975-1304(+)